MMRFICDAMGMVMFFVFMWFALVAGSVWEDNVRCANGYDDACVALDKGW